MTDKKKFRVGYFVWVDAEGYDESEASMVGEAALGWPGDWSPPGDPVDHEGLLNGHKVKASIIRSRAMMARELHD